MISSIASSTAGCGETSSCRLRFARVFMDGLLRGLHDDMGSAPGGNGFEAASVLGRLYTATLRACAAQAEWQRAADLVERLFGVGVPRDRATYAAAQYSSADRQDPPPRLITYYLLMADLLLTKRAICIHEYYSGS